MFQVAKEEMLSKTLYALPFFGMENMIAEDAYNKKSKNLNTNLISHCGISSSGDLK